MEKGISYLNRTFSDYKKALIEFSKKYYPDVAIDYNDASIASWMIDINADVADNLSYHIDRVFQETNINSANEKSSLYNIARNNGVKIPGPKGAMAEVKFTCQVPISSTSSTEPDKDYLPIIKKGTKVTGGAQSFELLNDVDFSKQFDEDGQSNRTITPVLNSNGIVVRYKVEKRAVVVAGESKIYRQTLYSKDIQPFMEVIIPVKDIMNIESIIVKDGTSLTNFPTYGQFYSLTEDICNAEGAGSPSGMTRFFEVESLAQQEMWGTCVDPTTNKAIVNEYDKYSITKGEWKQLRHKFITEYTDKGYLKIIFGPGVDTRCDDVDMSSALDFSKYIISKTIRNGSLGYLPKPNSTMFVLYRVGGGKASNLPQGAINNIGLLNAEIRGTNGQISGAVKQSLKVESTTPSVSGKDMPTEQELKYLIKYNKAANERCVTVKDYIDRILSLPPKYGTPFRVGVAEENNKIMVYLVGLDSDGKLSDILPVMLINNIQEYLSEFRMINDYVEIKSGKIVNLGFNVDLFIDKNYNKSDVIAAVIGTIENYMDINRHNMGDDIFVGDLQKEIMKTDGVISIINFEVWNKFGGNYSQTQTSQEVLNSSTDALGNSMIRLDLEASEGVIYSEGDTMLEIKYPENDIIVKVKTR